MRFVRCLLSNIWAAVSIHVWPGPVAITTPEPPCEGMRTTAHSGPARAGQTRSTPHRMAPAVRMAHSRLRVELAVVRLGEDHRLPRAFPELLLGAGGQRVDFLAADRADDADEKFGLR